MIILMSRLARIGATAGDTTAPTSPTITATASSDTANSIALTAAATDAVGVTGYELDWSPNGSSSWTNLAGVTVAGSFPYSHTGLTASTTYYYRCRARDAAGNWGSYGTSNATTNSSSTANFFISTTGSDGNNGTSAATPWAITALNTHRGVYDGWIVEFADGNYDLSGSSAWDGDNTGGAKSVFQIGPGTSGSPTILRAANARQAVINFKSGGTRNTNKISAMGQYTTGTDMGYVTIDGLRFTGGAYFYTYFQAAAYMEEVTHINCQFDDKIYDHDGHTDNCPCIYLVQTNAAVIRNCKAFDITDANGTSNGASMVLTFGQKGTIFENNECYNMSTAVYDKHSVDGTHPPQGFIARYNYIHDLAMQAFYGWSNDYPTVGTPPFPDYEIHHNLVKNTVGVLSEEISAPARSVYQIYNNTFINANDSGNGCVLTPVDSSSHKANIYNNIFQSTSAAGFQGDVAVHANGIGVLDYNVYNSSSFKCTIMTPINTYSGATTFTMQTSLANWKTALAAATGNSATNIDAASVTTAAVFTGSTTPADYVLVSGGGKNGGKVGGVSAGATIDCGCWGNKADNTAVTVIGCDF